jgi:hypothetical protein
MNNNSANGNKSVYFSVDFWLQIFGARSYEEICFLLLIPIGSIGFILNVIALVILRGKDFELPIYEYVRIYTVNSMFICLLTATRFLDKTLGLFTFTNSRGVFMYITHVYIPLINLVYFYQSILDLVLTFDRIVLFTNRFTFFRKLKPKLVCLLILICCIILMLYYWMYLTQKQTLVPLNGTQIFVINHMTTSKLSNYIAINLSNAITDILPLAFEIPLNIWVIFALRNYLKKKKRIILPTRTNGDVKSVDASTAVARVQNLAERKAAQIRKMEMKVTGLILFMSFLAFM